MPDVLQEADNSRAADLRIPRGQATPRAFVLYCLALTLVPVIAVAGSFFIARSSFYIQHQRNSYLAISDYPFTLRGKNCDVVIYGDSSALTGVSPPVIEAVTSLRTCNIAQPNTALAITGTFALDSYLKNNAPPKFLIFQLTAPDFAPNDANGTLYEEGALQLVRHKLDRQTFLLFARHPMQSFEFSEFILRTAFVDRAWTTSNYERSWTAVRVTNGLFTAPSAPLKNCAGSLDVRAPDAAWIARLRRKYSSAATRVLIYAAPYPECDGSFDYYSEKLEHLADNRLERFNIRFFNEQNHFTREGAEVNSRRIGEEIGKFLRK
ncbi:MAG TPA: hypothetical protein VE263_17330 [Candidatus Angelobacter sp.]|nr:hypothetical protein [Candidatus Angelobacter sp.]